MTSKGQVTIPAAMRRAAGLKPGDRVLMYLEPDGTIKARRLPTLAEVVNAMNIKVPPIDWKAARREMGEEIADKIWRQLHPEEKRD